MIYLDTNVIVYCYTSHGAHRQAASSKLISKLIRDDELLLSPLVIQELIFVLNKLALNRDDISKLVKYFSYYSQRVIGYDIVMEAFDLCFKTNRFKNINDAIHLKYAERYGVKFYTFDNGFNYFTPHSSINIEILK